METVREMARASREAKVITGVMQLWVMEPTQKSMLDEYYYSSFQDRRQRLKRWEFNYRYRIVTGNCFVTYIPDEQA